MKPKVSIIVPVYNACDTLDKTISSLVAQDYQDGFEILLIDDHSTDDSYNLIQKWSFESECIKVFKTPRNGGPGLARNIGIDKSKGQYVAFCDADDIWANDKLSQQINFMEENKIDFSYSSVRFIDMQDNIIADYIPGTLEFDFKKLCRGCDMVCSSIVISKEAIGNKRFNLDLRSAEDYDLWLRILRSNKKAKLLDEVLVSYRVSVAARSANKLRNAWSCYKIYRKTCKAGIFQSLYYLFVYTINFISKRMKFHLHRYR